jgi:hypothetical protein
MLGMQVFAVRMGHVAIYGGHRLFQYSRFRFLEACFPVELAVPGQHHLDAKGVQRAAEAAKKEDAKLVQKTYGNRTRG